MIKRKSILVRRPQDSREAFSKHWFGVHGKLVAQLPDISRYVQKHVIEEFPVNDPGTGTYDIDGFVELYFADDHARRVAFTGERVTPIWNDEVNFLGHSTAYVIAGDRAPDANPTEPVLVITAAGSATGMEWLGQTLRKVAGVKLFDRHDVVEVVARATMARGPQPVDVFFHLRFEEVSLASAAGAWLALEGLRQAAAQGVSRLGIVRVEEKVVI